MKYSLRAGTLVIVMIFIIALKATGQPVNEAGRNRLFIRIGLEPELVSTIGYTRLIGSSGKNIDIHLGASIKFAPILITQGAWRLNLITTATWKMSGSWVTKVTTNIYHAHYRNRAGVMNGLGFELRSITLHKGEKWNLGFDLGWQHTPLAHIKHSAEAKDTFDDRYPPRVDGIEGPKNGWYSATASRFRLGFAALRSLGPHMNLRLGIGSLIAVQKQGILLGFSHAQFPFYLEGRLQYQW